MNPPFLSSKFQEKRGGGTALTCSSLRAEAESPGTTYHVEDTGALAVASSPFRRARFRNPTAGMT